MGILIHGVSVLITRGEYEKVENDANKENGLLPNNFKGKVKILKYSPNQVEIETNGNDSGFLVLADNFYPGWEVYVNGREETVLRVNYNLRGVAVSRGKNRVTFTFDPMSFKIGAFLTLCYPTCQYTLPATQKEKQREHNLIYSK